MKRRVLVIGSPLSGDNHLVGVEKDIMNICGYFLSSVGGAYTRDEMRYLENPPSKTLKQALGDLNNSDISIVYFSGHGGRADTDDYIYINKDECIPVTSLFTNAKRQIIIIDSCRTPIDTRGYGDIISGPGYRFSLEYPELACTLYQEYVNKSPQGICLLFSTSENMPATDTENGGIYTLSLMKALHGWSCTEMKYMITIGDAFYRSIDRLNERNNNQHPQLQFLDDKTVMQIPFAINIKAHLQNQMVSSGNRSYQRVSY